jgi:hypothetical protein
MGAEEFHGPEETKGPENKELNPEQLESYLKAEAAVERASEKSSVENGETAEKDARFEALKQAVSVERGSAEKKKGKEASASPSKRRHGVVSKKERETSYKQHMKQLQTELSPSQRAFSKVIHNPIVEKTSEVVGSTLARPNAILAGAIVAFFLVLAVYLVSKFYGYPLSGFETIGAFIIGWILGVVYDFFRVMITGKKV